MSVFIDLLKQQPELVHEEVSRCLAAAVDGSLPFWLMEAVEVEFPEADQDLRDAGSALPDHKRTVYIHGQQVYLEHIQVGPLAFDTDMLESHNMNMVDALGEVLQSELDGITYRALLNVSSDAITIPLEGDDYSLQDLADLVRWHPRCPKDDLLNRVIVERDMLDALKGVRAEAVLCESSNSVVVRTVKDVFDDYRNTGFIIPGCEEVGKLAVIKHRPIGVELSQLGDSNVVVAKAWITVGCTLKDNPQIIRINFRKEQSEDA